MVMSIIAYLYLGCFIFTGLFVFVAVIIENYVKEDSKLKKWWRKRIIGIAPDDIDI